MRLIGCVAARIMRAYPIPDVPPMPQFPPVTRALLLLNILVYLLQAPAGDALLARFALWPLGPHELARLDDGGLVRVGFEPWQLVSYAFLHGSFPHIAFNMFALWMFGAPVENALGARRYTLYYLVCVLGAAVAQLATIAHLGGAVVGFALLRYWRAPRRRDYDDGSFR